MPPEALKNNPSYNYKLDVFSYGCLILYVFTQQWPVPTAQYVRKQNDSNSFTLVSEWNRRANYTTAISSDNPILSLAKSCLDNDLKKRPTMSDAIICAEYAVSSLPPMKNKIEMIKEIDSLMKLVTEKDQLLASLSASAKQKEIDELQTNHLIEHHKKLSEIASLRENESLEFQ